MKVSQQGFRAGGAPPYGLNGLLLNKARRPQGRRVRWKLLLGPTLLSTPKLLSYEIRLSNDVDKPLGIDRRDSGGQYTIGLIHVLWKSISSPLEVAANPSLAKEP